MSKAKNKKEKQTGEQQNIPGESAVGKPDFDGAEDKKRELKNENMFRMWNARPTQVPSVPKAKASASGSAAAVATLPSEFAIDWKTLSIAATVIAILAIFSHITGLFGQFVLNDQLILTPLKMGSNSDEFWSRLVGSGMMTPLSFLFGHRIGSGE